MMKKIRLKKENRFSKTIRFTDLVGDSGGCILAGLDSCPDLGRCQTKGTLAGGLVQ